MTELLAQPIAVMMVPTSVSSLKVTKEVLVAIPTRSYLSRLDGLIIRHFASETVLAIHCRGYDQSDDRSYLCSSYSLATAATDARRTRKARKDALEFFAKNDIEPGVEENVVAGRRHGRRVR